MTAKDVTEVTIVDDCIISVAVGDAQTPLEDEYDTNSGNVISDIEDEEISNRRNVAVSRSGWPIRVHVCLDFLKCVYSKYLQ